MSSTRCSRTRVPLGVALAALALPGTAQCQSDRPWGRISFYTQATQTTPDGGESRLYSEFITSAAYHSAENERDGIEFGIDTRFSNSSIAGRPRRVSIYDAWVGLKARDGAWRARVGQMWINEMGGLGSVAGGLVEYRQRLRTGAVRFGAYGGLEPKAFEAGYVENVQRVGGYVALDAGGLRRHVLGYALVRDNGLTERSVVTTTNYVPIGGSVFVYQAAEYDLEGPAGHGDGGLTYFFTNARVTPAPRFELQGIYHRGRSIDTRTITLDVLNGRPVAPGALDGLLFESAGGRVTVEVVRGVRVYGGYGQDKSTRDADPTNRTTAGGWASDVLGSGFDFTVSYSRNDRGAAGSYGSWFVSGGRNVTSRLYLSADYASSLSVLRFERADGFIVETRPETRRYSVTGLVTATRDASLLFTFDRTTEEGSVDNRIFTGLTYRLR
jgi:hypothetical protein